MFGRHLGAWASRPDFFVRDLPAIVSYANERGSALGAWASSPDIFVRGQPAVATEEQGKAEEERSSQESLKIDANRALSFEYEVPNRPARYSEVRERRRKRLGAWASRPDIFVRDLSAGATEERGKAEEGATLLRGCSPDATDTEADNRMMLDQITTSTLLSLSSVPACRDVSAQSRLAGKRSDAGPARRSAPVRRRSPP